MKKSLFLLVVSFVVSLLANGDAEEKNRVGQGSVSLKARKADARAYASDRYLRQLEAERFVKTI